MCVLKKRTDSSDLLAVVVLARNIWEGGHGPMASAIARTYEGGLGQSPQLGPWAGLLTVSWSGGQGQSPLKLKHFWCLDVRWKPQICPFFYNLEMQRNEIFVLSFQKIKVGHKTGPVPPP